MKLKADRGALLKALAHCQSVVERRNTIPILANVMIVANDDAISLNTTDMEISVVETFLAETTEGGACTVSAATLYEIVRKLPENAIIELAHTDSDTLLTLRCGRYETRLVILPSNDFPLINTGQLTCRFNIDSRILLRIIDKTRFAISTEETRYYLNGIYFHIYELDGTSRLRAVATDGHRLARVETLTPPGAESMPGVIVPKKTVIELRKLLDEFENDVEISLSDAKIQFKFGAIVLTSKLIDGTFPDYERVIPRDNDKVLRVHASSFASVVARVSAISSERSRPVKLSLARNAIVVSASSAEHGTANEELDSSKVCYEASPLEIGFQAKYLTDITDQVSDKIEFCLVDGASPTIVRDVSDMDSLYVLMPMRV